MRCQTFNAPLGVKPVIGPSRACANHHFSGGFDWGSLLREGEREQGPVLGLAQELALECGLFLEICGPFGVVDPVRMVLGQGGTVDDVCGLAHEVSGGLEISKHAVSPCDVVAETRKVWMVRR